MNIVGELAFKLITGFTPIFSISKYNFLNLFVYIYLPIFKQQFLENNHHKTRQVHLVTQYCRSFTSEF